MMQTKKTPADHKIMKASDYFDQLLDAEDPNEALHQICNAFFNEINTLIKIRHAQTNAAVFSIFDEQDRKWRAFARMTEGIIREDGFCTLLRELYPVPYKAWKARR